MFYYCTYQLTNGKWQNTAIFDNSEEAIENMKFQAQGRWYLVAESEADLEKLKIHEQKYNEMVRLLREQFGIEEFKTAKEIINNNLCPECSKPVIYFQTEQKYFCTDHGLIEPQEVKK